MRNLPILPVTALRANEVVDGIFAMEGYLTVDDGYVDEILKGGPSEFAPDGAAEGLCDENQPLVVDREALIDLIAERLAAEAFGNNAGSDHTGRSYQRTVSQYIIAWRRLVFNAEVENGERRTIREESEDILRVERVTDAARRSATSTPVLFATSTAGDAVHLGKPGGWSCRDLAELVRGAIEDGGPVSITLESLAS